MKKTDVKKTERSKEFLAEEWLEIVLKGQDKEKGGSAGMVCAVLWEDSH